MLLITTNTQKTHYIKHVKCYNFLHSATVSCHLQQRTIAECYNKIIQFYFLLTHAPLSLSSVYCSLLLSLILIFSLSILTCPKSLPTTQTLISTIASKHSKNFNLPPHLLFLNLNLNCTNQPTTTTPIYLPNSLLIPWKSIWKQKIPSRVAFFFWIIALGKCLTIDNLIKKKVWILDWCYMCKCNG